MNPIPTSSLIKTALVVAVCAGLLLLLPATAAQPHTPFGREKAPTRIYRDFHPISVQDGPARMISNDWTIAGFAGWDPPCGVPIFSSILRGIEPTNGSREWSYDLGFWNKFPGPHCDRYWAPIRLGWPEPYYFSGAPVDNMQVTVDLTDDGTADFLTYGWARPFLCSLNTVCFQGTLDARDGVTGDVTVWDGPVVIDATRYDDGTVFRLEAFPTGLYAFNSPVGPRFVWKTTDALYNYNSDLWLITERIQVYDSRKAGEPLWTHTIVNATSSPPISTYITGATQLDPSSEEFEIVYDAWARVIPPANPTDVPEPKTLEVGALRGGSLAETVPGITLERQLWGPTRCYIPPQRGNDPRQSLSEEGVEIAQFHYARLIDDVTGDDVDEAVCTHRAFVAGTASANGRFNLHIQPVSGVDGRLMWPKSDVKQQGYGFVSDLNEPPAFNYESWGSIPTLEEPDESNPYLGVGTVDQRQGVPRGARFPPKDTRLTTLKALDGAPLWGTYSAPFAQDNFLALDWALKQYATTLAGRDYTRDGVRELISAAKYGVPGDKEQTLLSTTFFDVNILDGKRGAVLTTLQPWGPKGMVVRCPGDDVNDITTLSGHARRIDVTRVDASTSRTQWREPWYLNPRAQAQTAGIDTIYLGHRCADTADGRTMMGYSNAINSYRRGFEILNVYGFENPDGSLHWLQPELPYKPPLNATLDGFLDIREPPPSIKEQVGMSVLSVTGGVGAAFGSIALFNRRRGVAA